nr:hypothetical protein [Actinoplanes sp. NBRC 103695]
MNVQPTPQMTLPSTIGQNAGNAACTRMPAPTTRAPISTDSRREYRSATMPVGTSARKQVASITVPTTISSNGLRCAVCTW